MTEQQLREWFEGRELPTGPIWLHKSMKVENPKEFVDSHFSILASRNNPKLNEPLIIRLNLMREWIEQNGG